MLGVDFKRKEIVLKGKHILMEIWDTGGQERFRTITKSYYERAMGVLFVYDCTDERSFHEMHGWIKQIEAQMQPTIVKVLVAAKCDLPDPKVSPAEGQGLAQEYKMAFFSTSAKDNIGVTEAFHALAQEICRRRVEIEALKGSFHVDSDIAPRSRKRGCC